MTMSLYKRIARLEQRQEIAQLGGVVVIYNPQEPETLEDQLRRVGSASAVIWIPDNARPRSGIVDLLGKRNRRD